MKELDQEMGKMQTCCSELEGILIRNVRDRDFFNTPKAKSIAMFVNLSSKNSDRWEKNIRLYRKIACSSNK